MTAIHARLVALIMLTTSGLATAGCGRLGAMSRVDPSTIAVYPRASARPSDDLSTDVAANIAEGCPLARGRGDYRSGAIDLDCFRFPEDWPERGTSSATMTSIENSRSNLLRPMLAYARATTDIIARNRLVQILMKHSDDICTREMGQITSSEATVNASLNILSTAATTAANIVTGNQAEQILTGIGTVAGSSRSHINADVYRNTVAYAISRAITLERQRLRELIEARYGQALAAFTVDEGVRAANQYHGVCSFYKGLELVLASVEGDQRSRAAQARRAQIDELEQQIRRYREQMAPLQGTAQAPYQRMIDELLARIQALTLAAVPVAPDSRTEVPDETPEPAPAPAPATPPNTGGGEP